MPNLAACFDRLNDSSTVIGLVVVVVVVVVMLVAFVVHKSLTVHSFETAPGVLPCAVNTNAAWAILYGALLLWVVQCWLFEASLTGACSMTAAMSRCSDH